MRFPTALRSCESDSQTCSEKTPEFRELLTEWPFRSRICFWVVAKHLSLGRRLLTCCQLQRAVVNDSSNALVVSVGWKSWMSAWAH